MRFIAAAAVLSLLCGPAVAAEEASPTPEKLICKRGSNLGSHLRPPKVCKTKSQWEEARRAERSAQDKWQRDVRGGERPPEGRKTGTD